MNTIEIFNNKSLNTTLDALFSATAKKFPDRVAIAFDEEQITYSELDKRSNQLARLLRQNKVEPGSNVAIYMERDLENFVAILGVLKAGGAYLPISPEYPIDRTKYILQDAQPRSVITKSGLLHQVEGHSFSLLVLMDELRPFQKAKKRSSRVFEWPDIAMLSTENLPATSQENDLAYLIYTSGTTGNPKGIMVEHRSVVNLVKWAQQEFNITPLSRVMQNYPVFFDASVQEIFTALVSGATLCPVSREVQLNPPRFFAWLQENKITYWDTVPSLWYQMVEYMQGTLAGKRLLLPDLETLILGGEALRGDKIQTWVRCVEQNHRIYNVYGPTEATVSTTYYHVHSDEQHNTVPIGHPLPNLQIYILDEQLEPCALGVKGEICIAGIGLARGYLNAPELTAATFVQKNGSRLYRTGDLGLLRRDGCIEFLGRRDEQVKVRGYRIELTEIESALRTCSGVEDAAVAISEDEGFSKKLLAYIVPTSKYLNQEELRDELKDRLPDYMIPHHIISIDRFPLTPSHKIDKQALLQIPANSDNAPVGDYFPPTTNTQKLLVGIWKEILRVDRISIKDSFFAIGGDSLDSIRVRRMCDEHGISLGTLDIRRHSTIKSLAQHIDTRNAHATRSIVSSQDRKEAQQNSHTQQCLTLGTQPVGALPLIGTQAEMLRQINLSANTPYVMQVILNCRGTIDISAFEEAINILVVRHQALRTIFLKGEDQEPVQVILEEPTYQLEYKNISDLMSSIIPQKSTAVIDNSRYIPKKHQVIQDLDRTASTVNGFLSSEEVSVIRLAERERALGFDPAEWPLFRITVYQISADRFDILWSTHHLIMDGWSVSIFYHELFHLYANIVNKQTHDLPRLRANFSDVLVHRTKKDSNSALQFWRDYMGGFVPTNLPKKAQTSSSLAGTKLSHTVHLNKGASRALETFACDHEVTPSIVCLTAYFMLLQQICNLDDLTLGVITSGREEAIDDMSNLIGNLINLIPLRVRMTDQEVLGSAVQEVKKALFQAMEYDYISMQTIDSVIGHDNETPLIEAVFVFENYPSPRDLGLKSPHTFEIVGVTASESNHYPLTLAVSRAGEHLQFNFEYASDLFSPEIIRLWSEMYLNFLNVAHAVAESEEL